MWQHGEADRGLVRLLDPRGMVEVTATIPHERMPERNNVDVPVRGLDCGHLFTKDHQAKLGRSRRTLRQLCSSHHTGAAKNKSRDRMWISSRISQQGGSGGSASVAFFVPQTNEIADNIKNVPAPQFHGDTVEVATAIPQEGMLEVVPTKRVRQRSVEREKICDARDRCASLPPPPKKSQSSDHSCANILWRERDGSFWSSKK